MASYNKEPYVIAALESVRAQTYPNWELIIIDDCSEDDSVRLIERWIEQHGVTCTFIKHERNAGIARNLNEMLAHAEGKYWACLGSDDVWSDPQRLEKEVAFFEEQPEEVGVIYGDTELIDESGASLGKRYLATILKDEKPPEGEIFAKLLKENFVHTLAGLIRMECFRKIAPFDESLAFIDHDTVLRIAEHYRFAFFDEITTQYRIVESSAAQRFVHQPSEAGLRTKLLTFVKHLDKSGLDQELKHHVAFQVVKAAEDLYKMGKFGYGAPLWRALLVQRSVRTGIMFLCSGIRLPYEWFVKVANAYASLRGTMPPQGSAG